MSLHLPNLRDIYYRAEDAESESGPSDQGDGDDDDDDDEAWDDWVSDSFAQQPCKSLFDERTFPSVKDALLYDQSNHAFYLSDTCSRLCLHFSPLKRLS